MAVVPVVVDEVGGGSWYVEMAKKKKCDKRTFQLKPTFRCNA